jgi:hypothetical protein
VRQGRRPEGKVHEVVELEDDVFCGFADDDEECDDVAYSMSLRSYKSISEVFVGANKDVVEKEEQLPVKRNRTSASDNTEAHSGWGQGIPGVLLGGRGDTPSAISLVRAYELRHCKQHGCMHSESRTPIGVFDSKVSSRTALCRRVEIDSTSTSFKGTGGTSSRHMGHVISYGDNTIGREFRKLSIVQLSLNRRNNKLLLFRERVA